MRIVVGTFAVGYLVLRAQNLTSVAGFDPARFDPVGIARIVESPLPAGMVHLLLVAAVAAGLAFIVGWRYRLTAPAFAVLLLWVLTYRNSWGQVFHTENLLVLSVIVLALSPAADAFSVDARKKVAPPVSGDYGWPVQLLCVVTVLTYFIAGQTKLRNGGIDWLTEDTLRNFVAYDNVRKLELGDSSSPLIHLVLGQAWAFKVLAAATLAVELGAPLALVSRRAGQVWAAVAWLFHLGILALMAIVFPYQLLGFAFAPFFPVERVPAYFARVLRRSADSPAVHHAAFDHPG